MNTLCCREKSRWEHLTFDSSLPIRLNDKFMKRTTGCIKALSEVGPLRSEDMLILGTVGLAGQEADAKKYDYIIYVRKGSSASGEIRRHFARNQAPIASSSSSE